MSLNRLFHFVYAFLALTLGASMALSGRAVAAQATPVPTPRVFALPGDEVYPEGVAFDPAFNVFYVGSTTDGTIFRGDLATGDVSVFSPGGADGRATALGMAVNAQGRLIVAGGPTGMVWVYATANGNLLASFSNGLSEGTFINDVAVAPNGDVYATDSLNPVLYRIPAAQLGVGGELEEFVVFTGTALEYVEGFNVNGLVVTLDGLYVIVIQSNTGNLFRVATEDGAAAQIDTGGADLTAGDGLALAGQTLYVCRNQFEEIVPVELAADFASGVAGVGFTDPTLNFPTTIALVGGRQLLVANSQFDAQQSGDPELPFTVSLIDIPVSDVATPVPVATPLA
jgi:Cu-Zn family superoxide dismutase